MKPRSTGLLLGLLAAVALVTAVHAAVEPDLATRKRMWSIAERLDCPVCQGQSVRESNAQLATQMREIITLKLQAGESEEQIMKFFHSVNSQLTEKDFISNRPVIFAGFRLDFGRTAHTYLDEVNELLYVWERGTNPSASIYNKKGIWISQQNRDMYNRRSWKRTAKLANRTRNYSLNKSTKVASK